MSFRSACYRHRLEAEAALREAEIINATERIERAEQLKAVKSKIIKGIVMAALTAATVSWGFIEMANARREMQIAEIAAREATMQRVTQQVKFLVLDVLKEIALSSQGRGDEKRAANLKERAVKLSEEVAKLKGANND